ncbi:MAG: dihydrofolate reductase [Rubrivivax sp.]|nr:dihydrofolate reductase [Rubrivivax sp.]
MQPTPTPTQTQTSTSTEIALIAAVASNGAIGRDNGLLFSEPADQRHFREQTLGCPVIMGRRTWQSLPLRFRPLPGRRNIVVTRNPGFEAPGAETAAGLEQALQRCSDAPRVMIIGGRQLYAQALPLAHTLLLTEIGAALDGDVHFPPWDRKAFTETQRTHNISETGMRFDFVTYRRKPTGGAAAPTA